MVKILIDTPTAYPALGYPEIARGLATVIKESEPRFAVGLFGGWGTGKTTLMTAIKAELRRQHRDVVTVDFNAWRFEREPQLLVPLLDVIRGDLISWAQSRREPRREKVRAIAGKVGQVVRALATGLSAEVGIPGAVKVSYDVGAALSAVEPASDPAAPQSLYLAAFQELNAAFGDLKSAGIDRVVVFVDDLDRCMPVNALEVLESIKLFFDLPGFVFVVGLDEDIVQSAVQTKFGGPAAASHKPEANGQEGYSVASHELGREYVKKIFQVPYALPPVLAEQLNELLRSMFAEARLDQGQFDDLHNRVRPYLNYITIARRVNPREVKRFINSYTLQVIVRPDLHPGAVLALQTISFRLEWRSFYEALAGDPALFRRLLMSFRDGDEAAFEDFNPDVQVIPPGLSGYLTSELAEPLTAVPSLDAYISSLEATTRSRDSWVLDALSQLNDVRRMVREAAAAGDLSADSVNQIGNKAMEASSMILSMSGPTSRSKGPSRLSRLLSDLQQAGHSLTAAAGQAGISNEAAERLEQLTAATGRLREELAIIRDFSILEP